MKVVNALLSCPSDVLANFGAQIMHAVDEANFYLEKLIDTHINIQHYLSSSYSQVGKPAQDHLDDTLVIDSDICLAFFYHKLGTATKKYKSGTDEEINLMRINGKHVSLFRIFDSKSDRKYDKSLDKYFDEMSSSSMYKTIIGRDSVINVVRTDIINYIVSSFGVDIVKIDSAINPIQFFMNIIGYDEKEKQITLLINKINELTKKRATIIETIKKTNLIEGESLRQISSIFPKFDNSPMANFMKVEVEFNEVFSRSAQEYLDSFAKEKNIEICKDFLSFQDAKLFKSTLSISNTGFCLNDCPIKEKIELLIKLSDSLKNYYSWSLYFEKWKDTILIPLALVNSTTSFQNFINIKLYISKKDYVSINSLIPTGEVANEMYAIGINTFLNPYASYYGYEEYTYSAPPSDVQMMIGVELCTDFEATAKKQFYWYFDYDIESTDDEVTLKLKIQKINAEERHCFPTYVVLNKRAKNIYYEIFGSSLPRRKKGKIKI